jgi:DNA-binding MarR family transcriptional regulator
VSKQTARQRLTDRVARAAADFGAASDAVDTAAAEAFRVNRTDLRILGLVQRHGRLTAGALAAAAGLSAAATTTAIQRLVAAGYLTRATDESDRRRVVLALTDDAHRLSERVYGPIAQAGRAELARFTDAELALIGRFLERGVAMQLAESERIRALGVRSAP